MDEKKLELLKTYVKESSRIVFFGGAGVSTESGIPDFRSPDGLYKQKYRYPPETIISHTFYQRNPEVFFQFYREKMLFPDARPNVVHLKLAQWEREGRLFAVVTARLKCHIHLRSGRILGAVCKCIAFCMGLTVSLMPSLSDDPPVLDNHGTDQRVWIDKPGSSFCKRNGTPHVGFWCSEIRFVSHTDTLTNPFCTGAS